MEMNNQKIDAIDLLIEDLNIVHFDIRTKSKQLGCEFELDEYKQLLISHLSQLRQDLL
jgi:hypothetical protein